MNRGGKGRLGRKLMACVLLLSVMLCLWFSGAAGYVILRWIIPRLLPRAAGSDIEIASVVFDSRPDPGEAGIIFSVSPRKLRFLLKQAFRWGVLFPRGLLRDGTVLKGYWVPREFYLPPDNRVPLSLVIDAGADKPVLSCRYPAEHVNRVMEGPVAEALRETEDYFLGSYDTIYYIRFYTLHIYSEAPPGQSEILRRTLQVDATGRVRVKVEENLISLRNTGKVKTLAGKIDFDIQRDIWGIHLCHNADIKDLVIDFHNTAPWLDKYFSRKLRKSWEKSLNKEKKKRKLAKNALPSWVPLDLTVDIKLTSSHEE